MTYNTLREILLEGASDKEQKKKARRAMRHFSYTSYSFRITHALRLKGISDRDAENTIVDLSDLFYGNDLPRFERTGSFDTEKKESVITVK